MTLALLLACTGSAVTALTVAVSVIDVPPPWTTLTVSRTVVAAPGASLARVQTTSPVAPTDGVVHDQPWGMTETRRAFGAMASTRVRVEAGSGPLFFTVIS